ncbi:YycH family regulatory protein [Aquibacillus rhizosphaerae]|uniref:Two-component system activity regulator YycH n=1 Tax=Aquibacillus rhizosphaerae TaxID=3051431 RepID=A0ABT7L503_9BACI|nr:two-component system activity regulator YycH [Aquibacillus sp. LR5S19]MDL4840956.1 two-component system activity regulator YycH [Aquibacillus sp. LR5S19]
MKSETVKTVILACLIGLSFLLTLAIWNYQPNIEPNDDNEEAMEAIFTNGEQETKKNIVQPFNVIYHLEGNEHTGYADKSKEKQLYEQMQSWSLYDFNTDYSGEGLQKYDSPYVELIFPTELPADIIADVFTVDETTSLPNSSFDRIYVSLNKDISERQVIFKSAQSDITISANIQNPEDEINEVLNTYNSGEESPIDYIPYEVNNDQVVYLPNKVDMKELAFRYRIIPIEPLKTVLFTNPSNVISAEEIPKVERFTDGDREMIYYDEKYMEFTDMVNSDITEENLEGTELLDQTLKFINDHNGWTSEGKYEFVLSELNQSSKTVQFRRVYSGFPVYKSNELSVISVTWNNQNIYKYSRPLIQLDDAYQVNKKTLEDVDSIISTLENSPEYKSKTILDVALGYKLEEGEFDQYFKLTPTWFIKDYSGWSEFIPLDQKVGGVHNAMGSN